MKTTEPKATCVPTNPREFTVHPEFPFTIKGKDGGDRIVHVMRMGWKYYCSAEYLEKMESENER